MQTHELMRRINASTAVSEVRYDIRGELAARAEQLKARGQRILELNIGNPGRFDLRAPDAMRAAISDNLATADAYCHQKGLLPARDAVARSQQRRGVDVDPEHVFVGNGVSELIDMSLRALLDPGDEVLIPAPDYPLWSAATTLNGGRPVYYPCPAERGHVPDPLAIEQLVTPCTRAIVLINPNNPTGAVYDHRTLARIVDIATRHQLVLLSDEIYDLIVFDDARFIPLASLAKDTLCVTFSGLSKAYRACGYRVGWAAFSGTVAAAEDYLHAFELLASLRLCSNVPGQWAVPAALEGEPCIAELVASGGRLFESRQAVIEACAASPWLSLARPQGALYAFPRVDLELLPAFDDQQFALDLLEQEQVLLVPGSSFNLEARNHFRVTFLPNPELMREAFHRIDRVLGTCCEAPARLDQPIVEPAVIGASC